MSKLSKRITYLYAELRRRKVVRTAIAYGVFAAGAIQFAEPIADELPLPDWTVRAVIIAAAAGFPIVLVLAWLFDITRAPADSNDGVAAGGQSEPASAKSSTVYDVPPPLTQLVGREVDLQAGLKSLSDPECRVLTITGPGGIGKTRLAQEIAARSGPRFAQGVCFVPLAGVESVESLPAALADALGLSFSARENAARQLAGFLQEKQLLLVLDNFEQIVDGASLLTDIVARAPGVRAVVTSRRRLRIAGETVLPLDSLSLPEQGKSLDESAAARLFIQVAIRNDSGFKPNAAAEAAIARICHIAGGIPLAIELAAATVGVLTCEEIANELAQSHELVIGARRDLPPRHQSLHAAFDSSWRLLDKDECRAFRRLSVFRSRFDAAAARAVADAELQLLARLVEVSLMHRPVNGSFEILEVLRQFAEEKLEARASEAAEVRARHSAHFLSQLAQADPLDDATHKGSLLETLAQHSADLRAAWLRAASDGRHHDLRAAAPGLHQLLDARGRTAEGIDLFGRAVSALRPLTEGNGSAANAARITLAVLLTRYAAFLVDIGDVSEAADLLAEALTTLRTEGDRAEIAFALQKQSMIARLTGNFSSQVWEECLSLCRELGDLPGVARALNSLGSARQARGEYDEAKRLYQESFDLFRRTGLDAQAWLPLNNLAGIIKLEGDSATARRILEAELDGARRRNNPRALSFLLTNLGYITSGLGDLKAAHAYLAESVKLSREMGYRSRMAYCLNTLGSVHLQSGDLRAAAKAYCDALTVAVDAEEGPLVPSILVGIARLHVRRSEPDRAAVILAAVQSHPSSDEETRSDARLLLAAIEPQVSTASLRVVPLEAAIQSALDLKTSVLTA